MKKENVLTVKIKVLDSKEEWIMLWVSQIVRCLADGIYTRIFMSDSSSHYVMHGIGEIEAMICSPFFFRIYKSHYINIAHMIGYDYCDGHATVRMPQGADLPVAREKRYQFEDRLQDLGFMDNDGNFTGVEPKPE
jgi:two-component system, LytTR family, response regulator